MKFTTSLMTVVLATAPVVACSHPVSTDSAHLVSAASTRQDVGGDVSLSGWDLTLPVNSAGELSGTAAVLHPAAVDAPWLTRTSTGGLEFWAPAAGAETAHSGHPRTELVNASPFTIGGAGHTLAATVAVTQLPIATPDIVIGQIHEPGPVPYLLLRYESGRVFTTWRTSVDGSTKAGRQQIISGIALNSPFSYTICANIGHTVDISVTYNGITKTETVTVPTAFVGTEGRFQAGDYQQASTSTGPDDGGRVIFTALSAN
ncbi:polysaccharide lyase family 7 protein [Nocardia sp. CA-120079]|uniref:polysaccharide lyase family 7 protein n=1 Tax=Nocardia sp. CA-120079 TaxID=3239974 RepID=UPI003D98681D